LLDDESPVVMMRGSSDANAGSSLISLNGKKLKAAAARCAGAEPLSVVICGGREHHNREDDRTPPQKNCDSQPARINGASTSGYPFAST
jgi:hypothetical protein